MIANSCYLVVLLLVVLMQIAVLNSTRLDPITVEDFTSWITNAFSLFKEWVGMFAWELLSSWDAE